MTAMPFPLPICLTGAQVSSFRREGFVSVEALTTDEELEVLRALYDDLFRREAGFDAGDRIELNADVARAPLPQIVNPERYAPRIIAGPAYRNAREIARQLLGPDVVATGNHAILKPARIGGETPWHQDEAYWDPRFSHRAVSVWLALQPTTCEVACELPAGGAAIHDGRTVHGAGPNLSAEPRRALVFGFGLAPVPLETPNRFPWQRPEWSGPTLRGH
jgi:ectoine hydroxylase-related dioxygenase (phytanoyl-CoA dioxygenase family)